MTDHLTTAKTDQLIRDAQSGDADAFEALLEHYYDAMYRFAYRWCGDQGAAEDVAQNSCMKVAGAISQYRFEASFSSWLYRLVINCAKDWQRRENRHNGEEYSEGDVASLGGNAESQIYLSQLMVRIDRWGKGYKETALLVLFEGLSHAEAGAALSVSEATISWRIHDIRKHLAQLEREQLS
ncbi:RNA polymerase sigma factor [Gilvimarinus sp. SDUM040013]|uniref:RNA polymerase sigma factor n=1 Tax=Gilvimarinus gilvus TaxID=3058038 RepID=A0ABU4S167_9GAMM|nr:RNA polymerase sigma factor [Gilvimarinus sp. SDUM040013]MDO3384906.1 RNA polymerase sigma factor [Gilvimarinus sp. SDUM040013]MDX6850669.1 RNA polymerase sigma factor [Gilvimarinus sp. SDUM040013]